MPTEVVSPVTRKGSRVSGNIPGSSPGAFSNPSRGRGDSVPRQPANGGGHVSRSAEEPVVGKVKVTGPEE
jgi:hypothetical protein